MRQLIGMFQAASLALSGVSVSAICFFARVKLRHVSSMFEFFLAFLRLSFYCDNILALDFYIEHACALVVVYTCFYFLLYFVYDYIV